MIESNRLRTLLKRLEGDPVLPQPVPQPDGISDSEINAFEDRIGIPESDDLREWLKISNGTFVGTVPVYGVHPANSPLTWK